LLLLLCLSVLLSPLQIHLFLIYLQFGRMFSFEKIASPKE
jgi:hypothetical protein